MPHAVIKMISGRTPELKTAIAEAVANAIVSAGGVKPDSVSVSIEDVDGKDWMETVYTPDIVGKPEQLFKKPGYGPT